jgi:prepilin-type processing-associated H-X9-DG protein
MSMSIVGIGTALPPHRISQADAAEIAQGYSCTTPDEERFFREIYERAGVETRHCVILDGSDGDVSSRQSFFGDVEPTTLDRMRAYESRAADLAVAAARAALEDARIEPRRVTHVITVTCSGFYAPGFDVALIKRLGLDPGTSRTQIGFMGCHGAINGIRVARAYLDADPTACVLLCAAELCSLHHQYEFHPGKIIANALFADGAAAIVGVGGVAETAAPYSVVATGSTIVEDTEDAMGWRIGNHGFEMTLASRIPRLIAQNLRPWLDAWLAREGLSVASVGSWAVHPGGPRILAAFGEATGLDRAVLEPSYGVLARYGNMSSPTILFILDRLRHTQAPLPCVALGFGPGLAIEAALLA